MPSEEVTRQTIQALRNLPEIRTSLTRAVEWEAKANETDLRLGWEAAELPIPSHHIRRFRDLALVRVSYSSRNYTHYLLVDREATRLALDAPTEAESNTTPSQMDEMEFKQIATSIDPLSALIPLVAPHVAGLRQAKAAVLLSLASLNDVGTSRGRINCLLHGPPGTAKSELLLFAADIASAEVYSPRVSEAGLTVDMRNGEPGALPHAHGTEFATVLVDEVEKVPVRAIRQCLQALEEGEFSYASASGTATLQAAVRFIGAANKIDDLPPEFLDRMDFLVHIPRPSREEAKSIVAGITRSFMQPTNARPTDFLRGYLRWIRSHEPAFPEAERERAGEMLGKLIDAAQASEAGRIRRYESILRVAFALARLGKRDVDGSILRQAVQLAHAKVEI